MSTADIKTPEWLEDNEIRAEYGSATLKYDIAATLVAARKMRNLTQATLAKIAGVSQAYIAKLESGEANPTIGRIGAILAAIWLKSEIKLVPLIPSIDIGIVKNGEEAVTHEGTIVNSSLEERSSDFLLEIPGSRLVSGFGVTVNNTISINIEAAKRILTAKRSTVIDSLSMQKTWMSISNIGFIADSPALRQQTTSRNLSYKYQIN